MANLFKGYAQKSDYSGNLLKGQDPSDKILEEGKRYLSGWKEASQGNRQDQERYLIALEAKFQAEEADRKRNTKLETYFAEGFEKALTKRHEGLIKNAEDKLTASQATAKKLEGWSESAVKLGVQGAQGFAKARQDHGMNLAIDLGLSWNTAKGIQDATGVLDETYKGTNMSSPIEYSAIKSGIISITKYLAKYYAKNNLKINCISPGGIKNSQPNKFVQIRQSSPKLFQAAQTKVSLLK